MNLRDALSVPKAADRRAMLRRLVAPLFEAEEADDPGIFAVAVTGSPICGDAPDKVKVRPTQAGVRDSLSEDVLIGLAAGEIKVREVLRAIHSPNSSTVGAKPNPKTATGYAFGHPLKLTDAVLADIKAKHTSPAAAPTTTTTKSTKEKTMNLNETVSSADLTLIANTYDAVRIVSGEGHEKIMDALLADLSDEKAKKRLSAVGPIVQHRKEAPTDKPSTFINELYDAAMKWLAGAAIEDPEPVSAGEPALVLTKPDPSQAVMIDAMLAAAKLPSIGSIVDALSAMKAHISELKRGPAPVITLMSPGTTITVAKGGAKPSGKVSTAKACDVFGIPKGMSFDFEVPVWEWDHVHPDVPEVDADYIFRPDELMSALYALISNERCWVSGHTGTGKTTLWEQIAARLRWPIHVLSFDSEITRADLIGQHVLLSEGGSTVSKFVEGIIPQCMQGPYILVCDEVDFIRPDVAYVMQRVAEAKGLTLMEDGGRVVTPHQMFRMVATANTQGQGDDFGMYAGARVQSAAFLDRFTAWITVDYLAQDKRLQLLKAKVPHLDPKLAEQVNKYTTEHIEAFKTAKVMKPISPRGMVALGQKVATFASLFPAKSKKQALNLALNSSILNACTAQDRVVLKAISDRVFA